MLISSSKDTSTKRIASLCDHILAEALAYAEKVEDKMKHRASGAMIQTSGVSKAAPIEAAYDEPSDQR